MSTPHQRMVYVEHLVHECGGQRDIENDRWTVARGGAELDVDLIEDGYPPRVLIAGLVTAATDGLDVEALRHLGNALPFGRLSVHDDGLWVTERIHMDATNPATFAHALDFVTWATGVVADELDVTHGQPTLFDPTAQDTAAAEPPHTTTPPPTAPAAGPSAHAGYL